MMIQQMVSNPPITDAELVSQTLAGNRDAFGQIVTRYQALVCSLAYSATGSLGQSEDLAQETFIAAWKHLRHLRESSRLRSWLCGIARNRINNCLRREGREPLRDAEPLENAHEAPSPEALPLERAISKEEEAILWRSLEQIPQNYREPLVLFYREGQSVERVAAALELSEDAVKQRLSRGRKLLQDQVLAFVQGALERTNPGKAFTLGVLAALPAFSLSAKAATIGATAAKGSALAKAGGIMGFLGAILAFPLVILGNYLGYRVGLDSAQSDAERRYVKAMYTRLWLSILGFFALYAPLIIWARPLLNIGTWLFTSLLVGLALVYMLVIVRWTIWAARERRKILSQLPESSSGTARSLWEYRSSWAPLGLPFVHIRIGGGIARQRTPVKAWIAAGEQARGLLFAFGGFALAPLSIGGCAVGLVSFGGGALGLLSLGGTSLGLWSFGGLAIGWQAFGGCAIAWSGAMGGAAIAHGFALGGIAQALQANNDTANQLMRVSPFFQSAQAFIRYFPWLNLIWVLPLLLWWRAARAAQISRSPQS